MEKNRLRKAGFTLEARFENAIFKNGEFTDELIYAIRKWMQHNPKRQIA